MTPDHITVQVRSSGELVGLNGKALTRDGSGWLSMQPAGYTPQCSMDAVFAEQPTQHPATAHTQCLLAKRTTNVGQARIEPNCSVHGWFRKLAQSLGGFNTK